MYKLFLAFHIMGGVTALGTAIGALVAAKGKAWHSYFGRAFVTGMLIVFLTAVPMTFLQPNLFLFLVAIFSFYLVLTGWLRARNRSGVPTAADWIASTVMILTALAMGGRGLFLLYTGDSLGTVLLTFAGIGGVFALRDLHFLRSKQYRGVVRIADHLSRMLGGTIAAVTAFSVVNFTFDPTWVVWLTPTIILTPLIVYWNVRVRHPKQPVGSFAHNTLSQEVKS